MEEKELNPEITPNERRGVDLVIKALKKKYNFIKGWNVDDEYREYNNTLFINLIVDLDKVSDYFGLRVRPTIKKLFDERQPEWYGRDVYALTAYLEEPQGYEEGYNTKQHMIELAQTLYKQLPPQLQRTYLYTYSDIHTEFPVVLKIHGMIME